MDNSVLSPQDLDAWTRTVVAEAGSDPNSQLAVANAVANRLASGRYGATPSAVVRASGQFEPWANGQAQRVDPQSPAYGIASQIVQDVAAGVAPDNTGGATHFFAPSAQQALGRTPPRWAHGAATANIGGQIFFAPEGAVTRQQGKQETGPDVDGLLAAWGVGGKSGASASGGVGTNPPQATQATQVAQDGGPDIDGMLKAWGVPAASQGAAAAPASQDDPPIDPSEHPLTIHAKGNAQAAPQPATPQPPAPGDGSAAVGRALINGLPIVGPAALSGVNHLVAAARAIQEDVPYSKALQEVQDFSDATADAHPSATGWGEAAGNALGYGGLGVTGVGARALGLAGDNLLMQAGTGAITGAAIGGGDAAVRSGGDLTAAAIGAVSGGAAGLAGPLVGRAVEIGANRLIPYLDSFRPQATAPNALLQAVQGTGGDLDAIASRMQANPRLSLMDVNPGARNIAQGLAAQSGDARDTLVQAYGQRAGTATDAVRSAYGDLGALPDVKATLDGIRQRAAADQAGAPTSIRDAFDATMGTASDPGAALNAIIERRSAEAQPLYRAALAKPIVWTDRLQQFLDDPVMEQGLSKGVKIQRLESLADGTPFRPTDYAIKDFDAAGDPIVGDVPNMKTLDVAKKGLDAMVQDAKDPITGRLSQEGVAIDKVRAAFVKQLDATSPTYAEVRAAWEGPTKAHQAFQQGLGLFKNASGMAGIGNTPDAIASFVAKASPAEADALKAGARAAAEQTMASARDPAEASASLVANEANRQKLAAILGPDEAQGLIAKLNRQYGDPIGDAFSKGADILRNRSGSAGLDDRPEFLKAWLDNATPAEKEAHQQGVLAALDQQIGSVRNAALKGETLPEVGFNRHKLEMVFGKAKADQLAQRMADEQDIAKTNSALFAGSQTQPRLQAKAATAVREIGPLSMEIGLPTLAAAGGNNLTAAALGGLAVGRRALQYAGQRADLARNALQAQMLAARGPAGQAAVNRLMAIASAPAGSLPAFARDAGRVSGGIVAGLPQSRNRLFDAMKGR